MYKLIVTAEAERDIDFILVSVSEYTGFFSSADKLFSEFLSKFEKISYFPLGIGRLRDDGYRETFCRGYRIVYYVEQENVYITAVIHSCRLYPRPE